MKSPLIATQHSYIEQHYADVPEIDPKVSELRSNPFT